MDESKRQLESLLADPKFARVMRLLIKEVMTCWHMDQHQARGVVLSGMGHPVDLAAIYTAWNADQCGLARIVLRRRVLDQLAHDARPPRYVSLLYDEFGEADLVQPPDAVATAPSPMLVHLADRRLVADVRDALACFATQGAVARRQAALLERYDLDERSYAELSAELSANPNALRVRVHKARAALLRHIRGCHPDLEALLDAAAWTRST